MSIELFTNTTPNGYKISIALEELGLPYTVRVVDFATKEQKSEWFTKINPNGRIPAIIDHGNDDFAVFESGAILLYLAERYGNGRLLPKDEKGRSQVIQWLMFQMAGVGPMQGQANVFYRYAPEKIPYAIERYQTETARLYSVLDKQLEGKDYLTGEYSIADIATYPWVSIHDWSGVSVEPFSNLKRWLEVLKQRPAVEKGMSVPPRKELDQNAAVQTAQSMLPNQAQK